MKEIDFTPQAYLETLREQRSSRVRIAGLVILMLLVATWYVQSVGQSGTAYRQVMQLDACSKAQDGAEVYLDELDKRIAADSEQADILSEVGGGVTVAQILAETTRLMSPKMSIRQLLLDRAPRVRLVTKLPPSGTKEEDKPPPSTDTSMELTGWASSGRDIGGFVSRISASPLFSSVKLRYQRPEIANGKAVVEFAVECVLPQFE